MARGPSGHRRSHTRAGRIEAELGSPSAAPAAHEDGQWTWWSTRGEMAASLDGEVKQPIAAAVMNAEVCLELLRRDQEDISELPDATAAILGAAKRATDIMDRVRLISRRGTQKRE